MPAIILALIEVFEKVAEGKTKTRSRFAIGLGWAFAGLAIELISKPFLDQVLGTATGIPLLLVDAVAAAMQIIALLIIFGRSIFKTGKFSAFIDKLVEFLGPITTGIEKLMTVVSATTTFASIGIHVVTGDYTK